MVVEPLAACAVIQTRRRPSPRKKSSTQTPTDSLIDQRFQTGLIGWPKSPGWRWSEREHLSAGRDHRILKRTGRREPLRTESAPLTESYRSGFLAKMSEMPSL